MRRNKGSPGIDGMTVDELVPYLRDHWPAIREQLLTGRYQPSAVRRHEIPKGDGGMRMLGIPTVLDRFIQQAVLQVLQPRFDPTFSESQLRLSAGAERARGGVSRRSGTCRSGRRWVVDVDLGGSSSTASITMCSWEVGEAGSRTRRVLTLIRRYLEAGMMVNGVVHGAARRNAARRSALTALGECAAGRGGSGVGATRTPLCALRR